MSRVKQMIELSASSEMQRLTTRCTCHKCKGNGWYWQGIGLREPTMETCSECGGTGTLTAEIVIRFSKNKKER